MLTVDFLSKVTWRHAVKMMFLISPHINLLYWNTLTFKAAVSMTKHNMWLFSWQRLKDFIQVLKQSLYSCLSSIPASITVSYQSWWCHWYWRNCVSTIGLSNIQHQHISAVCWQRKQAGVSWPQPQSGSHWLRAHVWLNLCASITRKFNLPSPEVIFAARGQSESLSDSDCTSQTF